MSGRAPSEAGTAVYTVVYYASQGTSAWWTRLLDQRMVHVEVWWDLGEDYWVAVRPNHCFLTCDVMMGAPRVGENGVTHVQHVACERKATRPMFPFGMKTCVTIVKAVLGLRSAFVITPRQLWRHIDRKGGLL